MAGKLNTIEKRSKAYWSLLKRFVNNKIKPLIPTIFCNNEFLTDFKSKAEQFNRFFAKRCFVIKNNSKLLFNFTYTIEKRLETIEFSSGSIDKIIQALDSNKVHGPDKINIGMLKICGNLICKYCNIIYKECLKVSVFPLEWKKGYISQFIKSMTNNI